MSIVTTIAALQTANKAITGVKSAPVSMPSALNTTLLPIALVWPGETIWNIAAMGLQRQEREYIVRCYVKPIGQGIAGIDDGYDECVTLLDAFGSKYLGDITLGHAVDTMLSIADSGVSGGGFELTWAGVAYWGFVFRLRIVEKSS